MIHILLKTVNSYTLKFVTWFVLENDINQNISLVLPDYTVIQLNESNSGFFFYDEDFDTFEIKFPQRIKNWISINYQIPQNNVAVTINRLDKILK